MGGGFQHRPHALICKGCGGQYFAASLPIHQKTCFQRNAFVDIQCTKCRRVVKSGRFHDHSVDCPGPQQSQQTHAQAQSKPEAPPEQLNAPEADGRVRCRNCDRGFHHERIAKHQSVCAGTRRLLRRDDRAKSDSERGTGAMRRADEKRGDGGGRTHTQTTALATEATRRRRTSGDYKSLVSGPQAATTTRWSFPEPKSSSTLPRSSISSWGGDRRRGGDDTRYDLVHRDLNRRLDTRSAAGFGSSGARQLNLSTSTTTSAANPLATTRLMTVQNSYW